MKQLPPNTIFVERRPWDIVKLVAKNAQSAEPLMWGNKPMRATFDTSDAPNSVTMSADRFMFGISMRYDLTPVANGTNLTLAFTTRPKWIWWLITTTPPTRGIWRERLMPFLLQEIKRSSETRIPSDTF